MTDSVLSAHQVHKSYTLGRKKVEVLLGVSLDVAAGEFVALRGASGAGKSTLLHLLGGLDRPDSGRIVLDGQQFDLLSSSALTRLRNRRVGLVFQAYHLLPELSALENVCLPARMARASASATQAKAIELLRRVGLAERVEHRPYELSGGEQQRVAIARALANKPRLLLADEPTGNLDPKTSGGVFDALIAITRSEGLAALIATHNFELASRMDRALLLHQGKLIEGTQLPR
jgi:lipoprotein-releasing system ATP-binding protein